MKMFISNYTYRIILVITVFICAIFLSLSLEKTKEGYLTVTVSEGDTLWQMADRYETPNLTKADFVAWIEKHNQIDGNIIKAGETLIIPVLKDKHTESLASNY